MISAIVYNNFFSLARNTNPLTVKASLRCTIVECVALAILGGCIALYSHSMLSLAGIGGACGVCILSDIGLFGFINRTHLFYKPLPREPEKLEVGQKYAVEREKLTIDGRGLYFYGGFKSLQKAYTKWEEGDKTTTFQSVIETKIQKPKFKNQLIENQLYVFTEEEREKVRVYFDASGCLKQIGLENGEMTPTTLPRGEHIFVLQEIDGEKHLYAAKKEKTPQGLVRHSSFFHGLSVCNAGKLTVDAQGNMTHIEMYSGHFLPTRENIPMIQDFLREQIPNFSLTPSMPRVYWR